MMKPIRYSPRQVALMTTFAVHFNPALARRSASAILQMLGLRKDGKGFSWNPR
jgi:hypothetical protein